MRVGGKREAIGPWLADKYMTKVTYSLANCAPSRLAAHQTRFQLALMRQRFRSFSPSPHLPTYASVAALAIALFLGLVRFLLIGML